MTHEVFNLLGAFLLLIAGLLGAFFSWNCYKNDKKNDAAAFTVVLCAAIFVVSIVIVGVTWNQVAEALPLLGPHTHTVTTTTTTTQG